MVTDLYGDLGLNYTLSATEIVIALIIEILTIAVFYVFLSCAIFKMAKNRGLKNYKLAFIPFYNFYILGKVIGKINFFGNTIKNVGLWVCFLRLAEFVLSCLLNLGVYFNYFEQVFEATIIYDVEFIDNWMHQQGLFYYIVDWLFSILSLISLVAFSILVANLFRQYYPSRVLIFSIISVLSPEIFAIILFIIRNNKQANYLDYLRSRQTYYGGYNQGGYNNNGYNQGGYNQNNNYNNGGQQAKPKQPEDPFPEFSDANKDNSDNKDDLFN